MENIKELLDAVKHAKGVATDYALAKSLDLPRARICDYYKGNRVPDEFACLKIAEALGQPLDTIIARVKAATEKDEKRREVWENYMKRLGGFAASFALAVLLGVTMLVTSHPAEASPLLAFERFAGYAICIMLSIALASQVQTVLRRVGQKCTFGVNIRRVAQIAT